MKPSGLMRATSVRGPASACLPSLPRLRRLLGLRTGLGRLGGGLLLGDLGGHGGRLHSRTGVVKGVAASTSTPAARRACIHPSAEFVGPCDRTVNRKLPSAKHFFQLSPTQ